MYRVTLAAAVVAAALGGIAQSRALSVADTRAIDAVFADYDKPASPGCMLGVVSDGAFLYTRGYGRANIEHDVAFTPETVFDIGSTSKQFLATSILLLVEDGKRVARRGRAEVPARSAGLRPDNHDPATVDAYQWPARLHHADDAGRLADGGRDLACAGAGPGEPTEGARFSTRRRVCLQQHRVLPCLAHRRACVGEGTGRRLRPSGSSGQPGCTRRDTWTTTRLSCRAARPGTSLLARAFASPCRTGSNWAMAPCRHRLPIC